MCVCETHFPCTYQQVYVRVVFVMYRQRRDDGDSDDGVAQWRRVAAVSATATATTSAFIVLTVNFCVSHMVDTKLTTKSLSRKLYLNLNKRTSVD